MTMRSRPIVDCDVHHQWKSQDDLVPYMQKGWQDFVKAPGPGFDQPMAISAGYNNPHGFYREHGLLEDGGLPASDPSFVIESHLDAHGITRALLTYEDVLYLGSIPNPYFAAAIARAANDWTADKWLPSDTRFCGAILVSNQLPELAAEEIRRRAADDRFVEVLMASNGIGRPFGHPTLDPIHRAAAETGIPLTIHIGSNGGVAASTMASGHPNYYLDFRASAGQANMSNLVSLIAHGVFEKYPSLRVVLVESGSSWIPTILWRMDQRYRARPHETPWLKRPPSDYFRDHVFVTTQPMHVPESDVERLVHLLEAIGGEDVFCFASDFPHWDADEVETIEESLPESWRDKVFYENACRAYGWSPDEVAAAHAGSRSAEGVAALIDN